MAKAPELRGMELEAFAMKVKRLRAEGLSTDFIVERLGVRRSTLENRMKRYKETKKMKSKGDPILDAQQLCAEPKTEQEVLDGLKKLGWDDGVAKMSFDVAKGSYVREVDGKFVSGMGTATDVVRKTLSG